VYRSGSSGGTYTKIGTITGVSGKSGGLSPSTTYYYKIKAVNDIGSSGFSSYDFATTQANPVSSPSAPVISNIELTEDELGLRVSWTDVPGAAYYNVYRASAKYGPPTQIYSNFAGTKFDDTSVDLNSAGSSYFYRITAQNSAGESTQSAPKGLTLTKPKIYAYNPASQQGIEYYGCSMTINGVNYKAKCSDKLSYHPNGYSTSTQRVELNPGNFTYHVRALKRNGSYSPTQQKTVTLKPLFLYKVNAVSGGFTKTPNYVIIE
jgi:hypothetical protein